MGGRKSKRSISQPRSHYALLSPEQREQIRPFVFFDLPGEIRNQIYYHLLACRPAPKSTDDHLKTIIAQGRVRYEHDALVQLPNRLRLIWTPRYHGPFLTIARTCKQAYAEIIHLFYFTYPVEIHLVIRHSHIKLSELPVIQISRVQTLRILITYHTHYPDQWHPTNRKKARPKASIDLQRLYRAATSLTSLHVSLMYVLISPHDATLRDREATRLLHNVLRGLPDRVQVAFGPWKDLFNINWPRINFELLDGDKLRALAEAVEDADADADADVDAEGREFEVDNELEPPQRRRFARRILGCFRRKK
ncbi:uncharacterized protein PV09_07487 [Verruconis gallopava]|uniref:DUF7730 domain-containing protein n=1 Tax=Verruconis gallopava TaxID=253628 RepID=A0A0D2A3I2_9PEZI|nr:uncharacterized protein PV09_07487 [Verruconis gallopava]KIW00965.1 hypothetical protein PV09_07487 [Verruconis gallopava]